MKKCLKWTNGGQKIKCDKAKWSLRIISTFHNLHQLHFRKFYVGWMNQFMLFVNVHVNRKWQRCFRTLIYQASISSTFYMWLFHTKVFCAAFLYLQFGFVIFWHKNIGAKAARKMLVKLTTGHLVSSTFSHWISIRPSWSNWDSLDFLTFDLFHSQHWLDLVHVARRF